MEEATIRNSTDDELVTYALDNYRDSPLIVELALRLEAMHEAADAEGSVESDEAIDPTEGGGYY